MRQEQLRRLAPLGVRTHDEGLESLGSGDRRRRREDRGLASEELAAVDKSARHGQGSANQNESDSAVLLAEAGALVPAVLGLCRVLQLHFSGASLDFCVRCGVRQFCRPAN